jgi:Cell wall binding domain 2 (CWB2)
VAPGERPINADLPAVGPAADAIEGPAASAGTGGSTRRLRPPRLPRRRGHGKPPKPPRRPRERRGSFPPALRGIAALVVLAVVFIVAAILGGGSGGGGSTTPAPAPVGGEPHAPTGAPAAQTPAELGYPVFATSNTTRVGGSDPSANAAAVALATYPAIEPSERPAAVTLVDAADWRGAVAAAVLMATPLGPPDGVSAEAVRGVPTGAPPLISEAGGVPGPTSQALGALQPAGSRTTKGVQAFAIGRAAAPAGLKVERIAGGGGAAATAAAIAGLRDRLFAAQPKHILIASSARPEFAMPAAAWAARSGDPVLYAGVGKLPGPTAKFLRQHSDTPVYVLGPPTVISSKVLRAIAAIDGLVRRVSGKDPVANSIALARYKDGDFGWNINDPGHGFVVARSDSPLDAVAAAPLSASGTWGPLLLTDSAGRVPTALREYLLDIKPGYTTDPTRAFYNHVWLIGDQEAIDVAQQAQIDGLAELAETKAEP